MDLDDRSLSARHQKGDRGGGSIAAVFLLGLGGAWSAGNVGPVVGELSREFGISLTSIGVLSGTLFYTAMVGGIVVAPRIAERVGLRRAMIATCALGAIGNLIFALSPGYALLATGRILAGVGLGFAGVFGPVFARATGGVGRVGLFGASFQLGIAFGLGAGSVLADLDVDWRVGFLLTALAAGGAIPWLLSQHTDISLEPRGGGFLGLAVRSPQVWRLAALFVAMFAVPLTLGAWLVHYMVVESSVRAALAGVLGFVMFGVSAAMREAGGALAGRGVSARLLAGVMPALAAGGLLLAAAEPAAAPFAIAVLLMGAGFALPYATMMTEAQRLYPAEPAQPTALLTMLGTAAAIPVVPLLGSALSGGDGREAFAVIAIFVLVAGLLNLRSAGRPLEPAAEDHGRPR